MKKKAFIAHHIAVIDLHSKRLNEALNAIKPLTPLTPETLRNLSFIDSAYLEVAYSRFGKLQDKIATSLFPYILNAVAAEHDITIIDKLNRLEKLGYLPSATWWITLRELRNNIVHDYEDDYDSLADNANELITKSAELIAFWHQLQKNIKPLL